MFTFSIYKGPCFRDNKVLYLSESKPSAAERKSGSQSRKTSLPIGKVPAKWEPLSNSFLNRLCGHLTFLLASWRKSVDHVFSSSLSYIVEAMSWFLSWLMRFRTMMSNLCGAHIGARLKEKPFMDLWTGTCRRPLAVAGMYPTLFTILIRSGAVSIWGYSWKFPTGCLFIFGSKWRWCCWAQLCYRLPQRASTQMEGCFREQLGWDTVIRHLVSKKHAGSCRGFWISSRF